MRSPHTWQIRTCDRAGDLFPSGRANAASHASEDPNKTSERALTSRESRTLRPTELRVPGVGTAPYGGATALVRRAISSRRDNSMSRMAASVQPSARASGPGSKVSRTQASVMAENPPSFLGAS